MRTIAALCAALVLPCAVQAATVGEEDTIRINTLNDRDFEVVSGSFTGAAEYFWCGAATYIIRRQGKSDLTPIYIKRPIGPSATARGRKGVVFSTSDAGLPQPQGGLTLTLERPGAMMSARKARSFCRDAFTRSTK